MTESIEPDGKKICAIYVGICDASHTIEKKKNVCKNTLNTFPRSNLQAKKNQPSFSKIKLYQTNVSRYAI
jgi:hypothetical protein